MNVPEHWGPLRTMIYYVLIAIIISATSLLIALTLLGIVPGMMYNTRI